MIDIKKKYIYRDGTPARILCVDAPGAYPVIAMLPNGNLTRHATCGTGWVPHTGLLIEVKESKTIELWLVVNEDGSYYTSTYEPSDLVLKEDNAIACKHIAVTYQEGEGLL